MRRHRPSSTIWSRCWLIKFLRWEETLLPRKSVSLSFSYLTKSDMRCEEFPIFRLWGLAVSRYIHCQEGNGWSGDSGLHTATCLWDGKCNFQLDGTTLRIICRLPCHVGTIVDRNLIRTPVKFPSCSRCRSNGGAHRGKSYLLISRRIGFWLMEQPGRRTIGARESMISRIWQPEVVRHTCGNRQDLPLFSDGQTSNGNL